MDWNRETVSSVAFPADHIRAVLRGVLEGLEVCHSSGIAHCSVHPDAIFVHNCPHRDSTNAECTSACDFSNEARRPFPALPILPQLSRFEHCIEFFPTLSTVSHLSTLHQSVPAYWSAPELCGAILRPKSKIRRRILKLSAGKVDIWSVGMLALTLIERNLTLSTIAPRTKDTLSTAPLQKLSLKQMSRLKTSPKIFQSRRWTTLAQDFVHACLRIDHSQRPNAAALLKHPFLTNTAENCLMSLSDVSESEASPLEDTYEDSMTYIPAPDSDSMGGSSDDWSDVEEEPFSSRTVTASATGASTDRRTSSDDVWEVDLSKRMGSYPEDNMGTSEESGGSVVIVSDTESDDAMSPKHYASLSSVDRAMSTLASTMKGRKRGKSDATPEHQITPSPEATENPLQVSGRLTPPSGPHTPPQMRNSVIRRKASSELLDTSQMSDKTSSKLGVSPTSGGLFGEGDSGNGCDWSSHPSATAAPLIAVHTHRTSSASSGVPLKLSHDGEKAARRFTTASTGAMVPSSGGSSSSGSIPGLISSISGTSINSGTSKGSSSSQTNSTNTAGVLAAVRDSRERTPSPASRQGLKSVANQLANAQPGRRSSLPLLPLLETAQIIGPNASMVPIGSHTGSNSHHSPHYNKNTLAYYSSPPTLVSTGASAGTAPGNSHPISVSSSTTHSTASSSATSTASPISNSQFLTVATGNQQAPASITTLSSKSSSLTEPFKPMQLSRVMRSRSEDMLIDKDTSNALQVQLQATGGASASLGNVATNTTPTNSASSAAANYPSSPFSGTSSSSSGLQSSPSGMHSLPSPLSSNIATSSPIIPSLVTSKSSKKKLKKHLKSTFSDAPILGNLLGVSAGSHEDSLLREIEECEIKWQAEIRKRARVLESKEKEISEKSAMRLRAVRKRYDAQIALISKRDEQRASELKTRFAEEKTRLLSERAKELDREGGNSSPLHRRNSFSGGPIAASSSSLTSSSSFASFTAAMTRRPSFPRRVLHLNYEKSVYDMDRRHLLERQDIELKSMEDSALVEREYAVQKYLVEQSQLELMQDAERMCLEDTFTLKSKMKEESKQFKRKWVSRKFKKLSAEASQRTLADDPLTAINDAIWSILLAPMPSAKATNDAVPGVALSSMEIRPEYLLTPAELTGPVLQRLQKSIDVQQWHQDEELRTLASDVELAEEHKDETTALNSRHQLELLELKSGFEAHYVRTRQEFLSERLTRLAFYETELVELKYRYARRLVVKSDEAEAKNAYEMIDAQLRSDLDTIASMHAVKRQQLTSLVALVYPTKPISASSSFSHVPSVSDDPFALSGPEGV